MSVKVKLLTIVAVLLTATNLCRSTLVRNGAYHNIVIEIQKDVPAKECSSFIESLESALKSSSEYLHSTFDGRLMYASFDIVLPSTWSNDCVNGTVTSSNGSPSDVTIMSGNQILITQQSSGCGEQGDQISTGHQQVESDDRFAEKFAIEWMKYRYGVFDVDGFENDSIYPPCGYDDGQKYPICGDALGAVNDQHEPNSFPFATHNKFLPSKQNFICDRQNPLDIIMRNSDFNGTARNQMFAQPIFNYVRKQMTRYVVIVDDHIDIKVRDSFLFLRDALRKWVVKDLDFMTTEVGILLMGNSNNISDEAERRLIKPLRESDDREIVLSALPWYLDGQRSPKCMINQAVMKSISMLQERARISGDANNVIVIVAPGMFGCSEIQTEKMFEAANSANVKISTINYPNIGQNRVEMDKLAHKTGGKAFTIIEKKQNEQRSLLTTFYELSNTLMEIGFTYSSEPESLPVEIYRKELTDSDSREDRVNIDNFYVDEATEKINFYLYIYDRSQLNIEKGMKLINPSNQEFSTLSELRLDFHQLSIIGNLAGVGSWSYEMKRFLGNPQPHIISILGSPKDNKAFIRAKSWVKRTKLGGPTVTLFTQILQGNKPIVDALVEVLVVMANGQTAKLQLYDNGSGDADVTRGDGIYSRYFTAKESGMVRFQVTVTDNGNTAYTVEQDNAAQSCCGSVIPAKSKTPVTPFQRFPLPITIFFDSEEVLMDKHMLMPLGRIGDLRIVDQINRNSSDNAKVILEWSAPDIGDANDNTKINYEIRYAIHLKDLISDFSVLTNVWNYIDTIPNYHTGQKASIALNLSNEPTLIGQAFYVAIKSTADGEYTGPVSNVVRVFVPKRRPTPSPHYTVDAYNDHDSYTVEPNYDDDNGIFQNNTRVAGLSMDIFIAITLCSLFAVIFIALVCWCCISRRKKDVISKKYPVKSSPKNQPAISVIVPQTSPTYSVCANQNQYQNPKSVDGSMSSYLVDIPDHQTIGLPMIDDDMMKPEFMDHEMLFEEMKQQRKFQQQAIADTYSSNGTMTRNGRYLSPYESWTASQLLHEHERRHESPMEIDPSMMYVDANGMEQVPPIPPHPYQGNYGYTTGDVSHDSRMMPPPHYSSVYRPGGSMQSVSMANGDKKIRNVTMV